MISLASGHLAGILFTSVCFVCCSVAGGLLASVPMVIASLAGGLVRFTDDFVCEEASDENKGQLNAVVDTNRDTHECYWKLF